MPQNVNSVRTYLQVNHRRKDLKTRRYGMSPPLIFQIAVRHFQRERKLLVQQRHPEDKSTSYIMTGKVIHVHFSTWLQI